MLTYIYIYMLYRFVNWVEFHLFCVSLKLMIQIHVRSVMRNLGFANVMRFNLYRGIFCLHN